MASLLDELRQQLDPSKVQGISQSIGANEQQTSQAISALVPMLIGGLSQNMQHGGAQSLNTALEQDHDGGLLDQLGSLLGASTSGGAGDLLSTLGTLGGANNRRAVDAEGILGHILGGRRGAVQDGIGQATGLNSRQVSQLMSLLAPLVMSALGRIKRQQNLGANDVADLVNRERQTIEEETPGAQKGGLLSLLDSNKDGKVDLKDDVAKVGMALGGALLLSQQGRG